MKWKGFNDNMSSDSLVLAACIVLVGIGVRDLYIFYKREREAEREARAKSTTENSPTAQENARPPQEK